MSGVKYTRYKGRAGWTGNYGDYREPWGMCDRTGLMYPRSQIVKQMQQTGNGVTWSGLWVGIPNLDQLDQQKRVPPVKRDPTPVKLPRPNPNLPTPF